MKESDYPGYIKRGTGIVSSVKSNSQGGHDVIVKYGTKLSDAFQCLPYGRINKNETGIGATTLELKSNRNSIIVQPLRFTASEKANDDPSVFFFGSVNRTNHTKLEVELDDYLKDTTYLNKKITVVADSLRKLVDFMKQRVEISKYFLLLDEIDSIQKDSVFRNKMEDCIEVYKTFPLENRAVISATLLNFSDPDLASLNDSPLTTIKYPKHKKPVDIQLYNCIIPKEFAFELIKNQYSSYPDQKILVAYNSVTMCLAMADNLKKRTKIHANEIAIHCGKNQKNDAKIKDYKEVILNKKLPRRINFITSAFFNGFDIEEDFILIIISEPEKESTRLSELTMFQIIGRCRTKLHSVYITTKFQDIKEEDKVYPSLDLLIEAAKDEINALECLEKHYKRNKELLKKATVMRRKFIENSGFNGFNFVKEIHQDDNNYKFSISHLNIDAYLEDMRVKTTLYNSDMNLKKAFEDKGYNVTIKNDFTTDQLIKPIKEDNKTNIKSFLQSLKGLNKIGVHARHVIETDSEKKSILKFIIKVIDSGFTLISILNTLEKHNKIDITRLEESLEYSLEKANGNPIDSPKKSEINAYFKQGKIYTDTEITNFYKDLINKKPLMVPDQVNIKFNIAEKYFTQYINFQKTTKNVSGEKVSSRKVIDFNPLNLVKNKKKQNTLSK